MPANAFIALVLAALAVSVIFSAVGAIIVVLAGSAGVVGASVIPLLSGAADDGVRR